PHLAALPCSPTRPLPICQRLRCDLARVVPPLAQLGDAAPVDVERDHPARAAEFGGQWQAHVSQPDDADDDLVERLGVLCLQAMADRKSTRLNSSHVKIS